MLDLEPIKARLAAATPGPWYKHNPDDDMYMNAHVVTNSPVEPDMGVDERTNDHAMVVAITMLQTPRVACHADEKWEENTALIAHAPADITALIEEIDRLRMALDTVGATIYTSGRGTKMEQGLLSFIRTTLGRV